MVHWLVFAVRCFAVLVSIEQRGSGGQTATISAEKSIEGRISSGDSAAMQEAEASGNRRYVIPLIGYIRSATDLSRPTSPATTVAAARRALISLITTEQMQTMVCQAMSEESILPVDDSFRIVGGWFGIQSLQMMLTPQAESRWRKAITKNRRGTSSDVIYMPPRFYALQELPEVVTDPPMKRDHLAVSPAETEAAARIWVAWIAAHKSELEHLKPTGEGVIYSEKGCR